MILLAILLTTGIGATAVPAALAARWGFRRCLEADNDNVEYFTRGQVFELAEEFVVPGQQPLAQRQHNDGFTPSFGPELPPEGWVFHVDTGWEPPPGWVPYGPNEAALEVDAEPVPGQLVVWQPLDLEGDEVPERMREAAQAGVGARHVPWDGFAQPPGAGMQLVNRPAVEVVGWNQGPEEPPEPSEPDTDSEPVSNLPLFRLENEPVVIRASNVVLPEQRKKYQLAVLEEVRTRFGPHPKEDEANVLAIRKYANDIMERHGVRPTHRSAMLPMIVACAFIPTDTHIEAVQVGNSFKSRRQRWRAHVASSGRSPWPGEELWWTVTKGIWK